MSCPAETTFLWSVSICLSPTVALPAVHLCRCIETCFTVPNPDHHDQVYSVGNTGLHCNWPYACETVSDIPENSKNSRFPTQLPRKRFPTQLPKQGSQRFQGRGSQRFRKVPGTSSQSFPKVHKKRFPRVCFQARFLRKGYQARFAGIGFQGQFPRTGFREQVSKNGSQARLPSQGSQAKLRGTDLQTRCLGTGVQAKFLLFPTDGKRSGSVYLKRLSNVIPTNMC